MKRVVTKIYWAIKEIPDAYKYFLVFQNWWVVLADWAGIIRKGQILTLIFRNGCKCLTRAGSSDRNVVINMAIHNEYMIDEKEKLDKYKNIIDIGGHIGFFTIYISQFCTNARVFSFEPEPQNYEMLLRNIKMNRLEGKVIPSNSAMSDADGTIKLYLHNDTFAHSTSIVTPNHVEVPCHSLEHVLSQHNIENCDLLKLNAEGAEYPILLNANKETLSRIMSIRAHCHSLDSHRNVNALAAFLSANGFRCRKKGEFLCAVNNSAYTAPK